MKIKLGATDWLFLSVAVIGIIVMALYTVTQNDGRDEKSSEEMVRVVYYAAEVADFVASDINVGDNVSDDGGVKSLGKVKEVILNEAKVYVDSEGGMLTPKSKEGYKSVYLVTEAEGTLVDNGVKTNGTLLGVGHTMVIRAGKAKMYMVVYEIEEG